MYVPTGRRCSAEGAYRRLGHSLRCSSIAAPRGGFTASGSSMTTTCGDGACDPAEGEPASQAADLHSMTVAGPRWLPRRARAANASIASGDSSVSATSDVTTCEGRRRTSGEARWQKRGAGGKCRSGTHVPPVDAGRRGQAQRRRRRPWAVHHCVGRLPDALNGVAVVRRRERLLCRRNSVQRRRLKGAKGSAHWVDLQSKYNTAAATGVRDAVRCPRARLAAGPHRVTQGGKGAEPPHPLHGNHQQLVRRSSQRAAPAA